MVREGFKWALLVVCVAGLLTIFVPPIWRDMTATFNDRNCDYYEAKLKAHERAMTLCYNDPFCRLQPEDWDQRAFLRAAAPRACAGLPALISTPHQSSPAPMPFSFPPETTAEAQR